MIKNNVRIPLSASILIMLLIVSCYSTDYRKKLPDDVRVKNMLDAKWGMFLHFSLGTFSNQEWTKGITDPAYFNPTKINTDQWCQVARDAGMGYIILVAKHHDGFCLWDTKTTEFKANNSPIKKDVIAELRKSCDKYGIKLCLYFSEADWTWPDFKNGEMKRTQLTELMSNYGEISLIWLDVAQWDGGLDHRETEAIIRKYQPNCFIGVNHGRPVGDLQSREMGAPAPMGKVVVDPLPANEVDSLISLDKKYVLELNWNEAAKIEKVLYQHYPNYLLAESAICMNQKDGKWYWFYNTETVDNAVPAEQIYGIYKQAVQNKVLFSLAMGPDRNGEIKPVDVLRLKEVGRKIIGINK